jgi:ATP-dependent DNA helicase RecG
LLPQEIEIIRHIDKHGSITALEVETILSIKQRRAREILKDKTDKGLLEKRGNARSTFYVNVKGGE